MALTPEQTLCQFLNEYLFDHVWNETDAEYRGNIVTPCLTKGSTASYINLDGQRFSLPDTNSYFVYSIPQTAMRGLRIRTSSWTKLSTFLNSNCLDLRITDKDGLWLYRDMIYVIGHPTEKAYLLAVSAVMMRSICGSDCDYSKLYVSVYYDSNMGDTTTSEYYRITSEAMRQSVVEKCQAEDVTSIVINGSFARDVEDSQLHLGYFVEIIKDPDKEFEYDIDLTDTDQCRFYQSTMGSAYKYIIHTPKALNPNKYVFSHNTVDFYIYPKNGVNPNVKGRFIHRFNTNDRIGQLTHQDYWIGDNLIQSYMTILSTTDVVLRVVVRRHGKKQTLIEDGNYITLLYELDDDEILNMMEGQGPDNLSFWRAQNLESSVYMTLLFKSILTNPIVVSTLKKYIDAIGYYNVMNILCRRVDRVYVNESATRDFSVELPISLKTATNLWSNLWINGVMIDPAHYTLTKDTKVMKANFELDETVTPVAGQKIISEIFEKHTTQGEYFIPNYTSNTIETGTDQVKIYRTYDLTVDVFDTNVLSKDYAVNFSYEEVTLTDVAYYEDGKIIFKREYFNIQFLIVTKSGLTQQTLTLSLDNIRGRLVTTGPLMMQVPKFTDSSVYESIPVIWDGTPIVFLDGRELAYNVDFSMKVYKSRRERFVARVIHVTNAQYFNLYDLVNDAENFYSYHYDESEQKYVYELNGDHGYSYLITDQGKIKISKEGALANAELIAVLNQDPATLGEIVSNPTTLTTKKYDVAKDIYLINSTDDGYILTGLSIEQRSEFKLGIEYTSDQCFHSGTGFFLDNTLYDRDIILYFHPQISMLIADGNPIHSINTDHYGYLSTDDTVREGAFAYHRGTCPTWLKSVMDQYGDEEQDVERLGAALDYLEDRDPVAYPEFIITNYSHHITSVIVNKVFSDTLDGTLQLAYDADEKKMLTQIKDYLDLIEEDPAMTGATATVRVYGSGVEYINTTYTPETPFVETYNKGKDRVWVNEDRHLRISWYQGGSGLTGRWVIENTLSSDQDYYYALDMNGTEDPWNLVWKAGTKASGDVPVVKAGKLNLRFIDIDASYTEVSFIDSEHYKAILQVMKGLLPEDSTKDGGTH